MDAITKQLLEACKRAESELAWAQQSGKLGAWANQDCATALRLLRNAISAATKSAVHAFMEATITNDERGYRISVEFLDALLAEGAVPDVHGSTGETRLLGRRFIVDPKLQGARTICQY